MYLFWIQFVQRKIIMSDSLDNTIIILALIFSFYDKRGNANRKFGLKDG